MNMLNFIIRNKIILMLSTGQDSLFLFFLLNSFNFLFSHVQKNKKLNEFIQIYYCHHMWQIVNVLSFWQFIRISSIFNLFYCISVNNNFIETKNNHGNENLGRLFRLRSSNRYYNILFFSNKKAFSFSIFQGHTLSDKIETYLVNFFRKYLFKNTSNIIPLNKNINNLKQLKELNYNNTLFPNLFLIYPDSYYIQNLDKKRKNIMLIRKIKNIYISFLQYNQMNTNNFFSLQKNYKKKKLYRLLIFLSLYRTNVSYIFCKLKLPVICDYSNKKVLFFRNKIRLYIIPIINIFIKRNLEFLFSKLK
uniref:tRNA(Ile)-lysidine synthase n=1 Tax=Prototheca moriformis TaxID=183676 RepID=UPI0030010864